MAANSLKVMLSSPQSMHEGAMRAHPDNSKMKAKKIFFFRALHGIIGTTHLYATAFGSVTPLLQPDHLKSHGYGPAVADMVQALYY